MQTEYDELPDGVVVVDEAGLIASVNRAAEELIGLRSGELVGHQAEKALPLSSTSADDWWACTAVLATLPGVRRQPEQHLTLQASGLRDGLAARQVLVTVAWIRAEDKVLRRVLSLRDAHARERAEKSTSELISTVAHELRSPLTSIKGFTATLLAKWERFPDEQKQVMLQTVNADADRVTRLLTELLDVSRIDAGRLQLSKQVVDLSALAQRVIDGRVAAGEPSEHFELISEGTPPEMWLDPDKMMQVVGNLVENGVRHGDGRITIKVMGEPDGATVSVSDEGEGVPEDQVGRIFTKFWRGQPRRGGTGLGLYICKGLVEAHGGSITVGTGPRGGADFRFRLPAGAPSYAA